MSRYKALRHLGCGPFVAATIATLNGLFGVPQGLIVFMTVEIEYDHQSGQQKGE